MTPAFDTLSASKRLRDAGVEERAAEAIVALVQSATNFPDVSGLATKNDIAELATDLTELVAATKRDISDLAAATKRDISDLSAATKQGVSDLAASTKHDIASMATKVALAELATETKAEFVQVRHSIELLESRFSSELHDKLRAQSFALMGGMTAIVGLATAIIKLAP